MYSRRLPGLVIGLLIAAVLVGCPRTPPSSAPIATAPPSVLGADDEIEVKVYLEESLSGQYTLDAEGRIHFPLVGSLQIKGLTPAEVADLLEAGLRDGYLRDPQVSVGVIAFNSRMVAVLGEVSSPGRYVYRDGMTLVEAIAEAGGTTEQALLSSVQIIRNSANDKGDEQERFDVNFREITLGRAPDFRLLPRDVVLVQESAVK